MADGGRALPLDSLLGGPLLARWTTGTCLPSLLPVVNQFGDLAKGDGRTHAVESSDPVDQLIVEEPARSVL